MFEDLYTLSVPLPEDILKAKGGGDYALVMRLIDKKCADPCLPEALRKRLELEKIISAQVPKEYPYTEAEARELLEMVELPGEFEDRYMHNMSGGQRQRVGIARALALEPEIIVMDEATCALDVSVQLKMLELIKALRQEKSLTILFISHDLGVIRYLCDEVVVMRAGRIVERGETAAFFAHPATDYGRALLDAVPRIDF